MLLNLKIYCLLESWIYYFWNICSKIALIFSLNLYYKSLKMLDYLFVYGTLGSRFENRYARLLRAQSVFAGEATVRGTIRDMGAYPAFRREPDGLVHGELYQLRTPESTLAALDEYEGDEFERVVIDCGGRPAWIYQYRNGDLF
jgi:gamma-glutamylcyclotransferase (GGCT)/AIG2-like uncharacterized protein YtfP